MSSQTDLHKAFSLQWMLNTYIFDLLKLSKSETKMGKNILIEREMCILLYFCEFLMYSEHKHLKDHPKLCSVNYWKNLHAFQWN